MMNEYSTYCTREQTEQAYKMGAPIEVVWNGCDESDDYVAPTTQQIINWLEEKGQIIEVFRLTKNVDDFWAIFINNIQEADKYFEQRYEAELYAIDVALTYLERK